MSNKQSSARLRLGYSPLTKKIVLAKMVEDGAGRRRRVGDDIGQDVSNEAAQMVWQLVSEQGGEIGWDLDDGSRMVLKAHRVTAIADKPEATDE